MGKGLVTFKRAPRRFSGGDRTIHADSSAVAKKNSVAVRHGVGVRGNVYGNIYLTYQSAPGRGLLPQQDFERILDEYLRWVVRTCGTARLYGLESPPAEKGPAVRRDLS